MFANIIRDTTALASPSICSIPHGTIWSNGWKQAFTYSQQCYNPGKGSDGCNFFYNQSIACTERTIDMCPFKGNVCVLHEKSAYNFDAGYVDSKHLGINAAKRHHFRRRSTCAPLLPDGENIKEVNSSATGLSGPIFGVQGGGQMGMGSYNMSWKPYKQDVGLYKRSVSRDLSRPPLITVQGKFWWHVPSTCYQPSVHGCKSDQRCLDNHVTYL
jgi:hypothetical protein